MLEAKQTNRDNSIGLQSFSENWNSVFYEQLMSSYYVSQATPEDYILLQAEIFIAMKVPLHCRI